LGQLDRGGTEGAASTAPGRERSMISYAVDPAPGSAGPQKGNQSSDLGRQR
jgi:hypothetical protein